MVFDLPHSQGDRINLSVLDANSLSSGNHAFSFIGETGFTGKAGELHYVNSNGDTFVQADINGDRWRISPSASTRPSTSSRGILFAVRLEEDVAEAWRPRHEGDVLHQMRSNVHETTSAWLALFRGRRYLSIVQGAAAALVRSQPP